MNGLVFIGSLLMTPISAGRPFSAQYERTVVAKDSGKTTSEHGAVLVDREGRARSSVVGEVPIAAIWDPIAKAAWIVDGTSNRVLTDIPWPSPSPKMGGDVNVAAPERQRTPAAPEQLGKRTIEGLECEGSRFHVGLPNGLMLVERWFSPSLGHVVLETTDTPSERVTFRMSAITRTDPNPELFRPRLGRSQSNP